MVDKPQRDCRIPEGAGPAQWIVCERRGRWAVALRREPAAVGMRLREAGALALCWEMVRGHPASFVVLELTSANVDEVLGALARLAHEFPLVRAAVVADRAMAAWEGLVREVGAAWFAASPREVGPIAEMAGLHLAKAPLPRRSLTERIWATLPWEP